MKQLGATIPRETLANWCIISAVKYLLPIYEILQEELLRSEVIHTNKTTCQVLKEERKTAQSTSYTWIYTSGTDGLPGIVMYEYQPGRGGIYPDTMAYFSVMVIRAIIRLKMYCSESGELCPKSQG